MASSRRSRRAERAGHLASPANRVPADRQGAPDPAARQDAPDPAARQGALELPPQQGVLDLAPAPPAAGLPPGRAALDFEARRVAPNPISALRRVLSRAGGGGGGAGGGKGIPAGAGPLVLAYSGGLDSSVLLHAAAAVLPPARLCVVHVDHGLQQNSSEWAEHCRREVETLGLSCHVLRLEGRPARGESVEAWARTARYEAIVALARELNAGMVLTAHHSDDQIETFLIRLARGAGLDGLIGIEAESWRDGLRLLRPFLDLPRSALEAWARARQLRWIEDPSNADERLLRNAIRRQLAPVIDRVLPGFRHHLPATLGALAQAREVLHERQRLDLQSVAVQSPDFGLCLSLSGWRMLPYARRAGVLRSWLAGHGTRMPSRARLSQMLDQLESPRSDAMPRLHHDGRVLCRYRDLVACLAAPVGAASGAVPQADTARAGVVPIVWTGQERIECRELGGALRIEAVHERGGAGLAGRWLRSADLQLRRRAGGERLRIHTSGRHRSLKNLFQERGVPPWIRTKLPVLWAEGRPVWVPRIGIDADCRAQEGERYRLWWVPDPGEPAGGASSD
jgi:tRNA(Ile)-lysidine synthase